MSHNGYYSAYTAEFPYYPQSSTQYTASHSQSSYDPPPPYNPSPAMSYSLSSRSNSSSGSAYGQSQGTVAPSQLYLSKPSNPYEPYSYVQPAAQTYDVSPSASGSKASSSKLEKSYPCLIPGCLSAAKGSKFTRAADLDRHLKTVHYPSYLDCPHEWCGRTGKGGFSRKDHLNEHLKQMHMGVPVPPRKR